MIHRRAASTLEGPIMRASLTTLFTLLAIVGLLGTGLCIGEGSGMYGTVGTAALEAPTGWSVYRHDRCGFQVLVPPSFERTEVPDPRLVDGTLVAFAPVSDLSRGKDGRRTNLLWMAVTVRVTDITAAAGIAAPSLAPRDRLHERYPSFVWTRLAEGAVGNRYETVSAATRLPGARVEITLLLHSANPDCYPPGTVTIFDGTEILRLFEMMVRTFSPSVADTRRLLP
jgi:hypothetical protein